MGTDRGREGDYDAQAVAHDSYDAVVVGAGIVGLATALALTEKAGGAAATNEASASANATRRRILVIDKEARLAAHQTGNNSGVIHSGIYYKPDSYKAEFCKRGRESLVEFCLAHGVRFNLCGKIIIATEPTELPRLDALYERGLQHGLKLERLTPEQARAIEPHVECLAALRVPETGIVDYKEVCAKMAELLRARGVEIRLKTEVVGIAQAAQTGPAAQAAPLTHLVLREHTEGPTEKHESETRAHTLSTKILINCAGLHSDRVARLAGITPPCKIVPFRGEYYELKEARRGLVRTLIYPVPNPDFPFLGVHFTKMIDGSVHAGPNAVLAFKREGYTWCDFSARDLCETLGFSGFWRLAWRNLDEGLREILRSVSRARFVASLRKMIPEVTGSDLIPAHAGVRAQALKADGALVDDFLIVTTPAAAGLATGPTSIHVLNAPSPAATSALEIGRHIAGLAQI